MNLTTDPWIPVLMRDGNARLVSLRGVFAEGADIADLAVRPHERIALMRLIICIAQAALDGPEDIEAWQSAPALLPAAAAEYLTRPEIAGAFNLFDPQRPFLQIAGLVQSGDKVKKEGPTSASKLDFGLATGNNSTLFDNAAASGHRVFPSAKLALELLAFQNFDVSGTIGVAVWSDTLTPKAANDGKGNADHAPCLPRSMLHTFVRRDNLFETIHANLLTKATIKHSYDRPWGQPIWERWPVAASDGANVENATSTYLGRLVPLSRAILIHPNRRDIVLGNGLSYPAFTAEVPEFSAEPTATVVPTSDKKGHRVLSGSSKAIWRELFGLTAIRHAGETGGALALENLDTHRSFDIWVGALLSEKGKGVVDGLESVCHIPAQMLTEAGRAEYDDEVKAAERKAKALGAAIVKWRELVDGAWPGKVKSDPKARGKIQAAASRHYWSTVERSLSHLEKTITAEGEARDAARDAWRKVLRDAALAAFELVCSRETPRQLRAFALGRAELFRKPKVTEETPDDE